MHQHHTITQTKTLNHLSFLALPSHTFLIYPLIDTFFYQIISQLQHIFFTLVIAQLNILWTTAIISGQVSVPKCSPLPLYAPHCLPWSLCLSVYHLYLFFWEDYLLFRERYRRVQRRRNTELMIYWTIENQGDINFSQKKSWQKWGKLWKPGK